MAKTAVAPATAHKREYEERGVDDATGAAISIIVSAGTSLKTSENAEEAFSVDVEGGV